MRKQQLAATVSLLLAWVGMVVLLILIDRLWNEGANLVGIWAWQNRL